MKKTPTPYPKPGPTGGRLIREVIGHLRAHKVALPLDSHILIAASAGADSMALAHLLVHYGRRVVGKDQNITLLHVNHGWRGECSDADERFVREAGRRWRVPVKVVRLKPPRGREKQGWEDLARTARKRVFARWAKEAKALVLTAHHADDLAETVLWRLLTGTQETHGGGIAVSYGMELRPFLGIRKKMLKQYLLEEGESWREDSTNEDPRFLRAKMRLELIPVLERVFPRAIERLAALGLNAQLQAGRAEHKSCERNQGLMALFGAAGLRIRRPHWEQMAKLEKSHLPRPGTHLPEGWRLVHERKHGRWILEKVAAGRPVLKSKR